MVGSLLQALVLSQPELVRSLTLISTASRLPDAARAAMRALGDTVLKGGMEVMIPGIEHWLSADKRAVRPDLVDRITKTLLANDPAVHAFLCTHMVAEFDVLEQLNSIRCPTLALVCEDDPSTPLACSVAITEHIEGARLVVLPNLAAHLAPLEAPAEVNIEILKFLSDV